MSILIKRLSGLTAAVLLLLVGTACQSGASPAPPPAYVMDAAGAWQAMGQSSYCWSGSAGANIQRVCADSVWPPDSQVSIEVGVPLRFQFFRPPDSLNVTLYQAQNPAGNPVLFTTLTPTDREIIWMPNVPAGAYLVQVFAKWGPDDSSTFAWITIVESEADEAIPFQPQSETVRPVYLLLGEDRLPGEVADRVGDDGRLVFVPPSGEPISLAVGEALTAVTDPPPPTRIIFLIETGDGSETVLDSAEAVVENNTAMWTPDVSAGRYVLVVTAEWPDTLSVVAFNVEVE